MDSTEHDVGWRKSSRSNGSGACVEVGNAGGTIVVRDTTNRAGGTLTFPDATWQEFCDALKRPRG